MNIFVLGDNRDNSNDSRYKEVGPVKRSKITGRIIFRFYPWKNAGVIPAIGRVLRLMTKKEEREARKLEKLRLEKERMYEMFSFEREYGDHQAICGIDEVGRGPFAGPVVAAAVILPKDCDILYLNDSKKLSEKKGSFYMMRFMRKQLQSVLECLQKK